MAFDPVKCKEISNAISAIYDREQATVSEACAATSLALRVMLENERDLAMRAYFLMNVMKHLTMDPKPPVIDLLKPNGHGD